MLEITPAQQYTSTIGSVFVFLGEPVDQLLLLAGGVAGGLGVILKD